MVTFDTSAFGAVSEFFDQKRSTLASNDPSKDTTPNLKNTGSKVSGSHNESAIGRKSRLGVGAKISSKSIDKEDASNSGMRESIVTNKKTRRKRQDWDEDSEIEDAQDLIDGHFDHEEEEGRTSISAAKPKGSKYSSVVLEEVTVGTLKTKKKKKKKLKDEQLLGRAEISSSESISISNPAKDSLSNEAKAEIEASKQNTKKKGKQERQCEVRATEEHDNHMEHQKSEVTGIDIYPIKGNNNAEVEWYEEGKGNKEDKKLNWQSNNGKKKSIKHKKIRSKQKNIRKDTRRAMDKPSHLILGRSDYAGRPITPETRSKLNMPMRAKPIQSQPKSKLIRSHVEQNGEGMLSGLAVDDLVNDARDVDDKEVEKKKSAKKPKKSKYRNLQ